MSTSGHTRFLTSDPLHEGKRQTRAKWAMADTNNFWLAAQYDWRSKRGLYLNLENSSEGDDWRFISASRSWEFDTKYLSKAVVGPNGAELWLDGSSHGGFRESESAAEWTAYPTCLCSVAEVYRTWHTIRTSSTRRQEPSSEASSEARSNRTKTIRS